MYRSAYSRHLDCQINEKQGGRKRAVLFLCGIPTGPESKRGASKSEKTGQCSCGYGNASRSTKVPFQSITDSQLGTLLAQHGVRDVEQFDLWVVAQVFSDKVIVGLKNWR
jgi:hypothetical protein